MGNLSKIFLSTIFIFFGFQAYSQQNMDSLFRVLNSMKEDSDKVMFYNDFADGYMETNFDSAIKYATAGLNLAKKLQWDKGIVYSYNRIGFKYQDRGDFTEALKDHNSALSAAQKSKYQHGMAVAYLGIGNIYGQQGNYPEALRNHINSLKISEKNKDTNIIAQSYNSIGNIYDLQGNYQKAIENYTAYLKIMQVSGSQQGVAVAYCNIGLAYEHENNYDSAEQCYIMAITIASTSGDKNILCDVYENIGRIFLKRGKYDEAAKNFQISLKIACEIGNKIAIAADNIEIGSALSKLKKYIDAEKHCAIGLNIAKEVGSLEKQSLAEGELYKIYESLGDFKTSLKHYKILNVLIDSLNSKGNSQKILQIQMQYDFDKKKTADELKMNLEFEKKSLIVAKELQRQRLLRNGFLGGFVLVLAFAGIFFTQRNKIKAANDKSEALLLNILPAEVAEELKEKGYADAKMIDEVTVLFTDVKGFTQISQQMSPTDLVAEINECFSAFDLIMEKYGVEKIKTIGDSYMAAGGLPSPNKTHAADVVNAALDIQEYMIEHKKRKQTEGKLAFELRIGVHTGPVVAGIVGIKKFQYDIWGDTVNTASRMESSGDVGKVNISGATFVLVKDKFTCEYRGKVSAKGKGEVDMYFVSRQ